MAQDPPLWPPDDTEQGTTMQASPPMRAEIDDRGGVYRNGEHDPRADPPPMTRAPRQGESHPKPPQAEWGEGVITGDPHDHYVHLANGAVITGCSGGTHVDDPDYGLIPITAVFPAGRNLT